jgi:hypothetical protein
LVLIFGTSSADDVAAVIINAEKSVGTAIASISPGWINSNFGPEAYYSSPLHRWHPAVLATIERIEIPICHKCIGDAYGKGILWAGRGGLGIAKIERDANPESAVLTDDRYSQP